MRSRPLKFSDFRLCVLCTRCRMPVQINHDESFLAMIGHILKLRCPDPKCRFEDWYLESEVFQNPAYAPLPGKPSQSMIPTLQ